MKYTITHKPAGKMVHHTVTDETGHVVGTRTSAHTYNAAVIGFRPSATVAKNARADAAYSRTQAAKYPVGTEWNTRYNEIAAADESRAHDFDFTPDPAPEILGFSRSFAGAAKIGQDHAIRGINIVAIALA